jgi:hypothetical protein
MAVTGLASLIAEILDIMENSEGKTTAATRQDVATRMGNAIVDVIEASGTKTSVSTSVSGTCAGAGNPLTGGAGSQSNAPGTITVPS